MSPMALLVITVVSAALAVAMSAIAWRLSRQERRRAEARIAALAAEIQVPESRLDAPAAAVSGPAAVTYRPVVGIRSEPARWPAASAPARPAFDRSAAVTHDLPLRDTPFAPPAAHLFDPPSSPASAGLRLATVVGLGVLVLGTAAALVVLLTPGPRTAPARTAAAPASRQVAPDTWPLELIALGHERDGDQLMVRGVVRNPVSGPPVDRLTAVVFLFNQDGGFVTSARAAIASSGLNPGRESTFVVPVPNAGTISRYRVSFRTDERVVPHLDKREPAAVARVQ